MDGITLSSESIARTDRGRGDGSQADGFSRKRSSVFSFRRLYAFLKGGVRQKGVREAISECEAAIEVLKRRQTALEKQMAAAKDEMLERLDANDRGGARGMLRRCKLYELEIDQVDKFRFKLESMIFSLESALTQRRTVDALAKMNSTHKDVVSTCNVRNVVRLLKDIDTLDCAQTQLSKLITATDYTDRLHHSSRTIPAKAGREKEMVAKEKEKENDLEKEKDISTSCGTASATACTSMNGIEESDFEVGSEDEAEAELFQVEALEFERRLEEFPTLPASFNTVSSPALCGLKSSNGEMSRVSHFNLHRHESERTHHESERTQTRPRAEMSNLRNNRCLRSTMLS